MAIADGDYCETPWGRVYWIAQNGGASHFGPCGWWPELLRGVSIGKRITPSSSPVDTAPAEPVSATDVAVEVSGSWPRAFNTGRPDTIETGYAYRIEVRVRNVGKAATSACPVDLRETREGEKPRVVMVRECPHLEPGQSELLEFVYRPATACHCVLEVVVDPDSILRESPAFRRNNQVAKDFFVVRSPQFRQSARHTAWIGGTVLGTNRLVPDLTVITVELWDDESLDVLATTSARADGTFAFANVPAGRYRAYPRADAERDVDMRLFESSAPFRVIDGERKSGVSVRLCSESAVKGQGAGQVSQTPHPAPGTIRGALRRKRNGSMTLAAVTVHLIMQPPDGDAHVVQSVVPKADGTFEFTKVPAGKYVVNPSYGGKIEFVRFSRQVEVDLKAGETRTGIEFVVYE